MKGIGYGDDFFIIKGDEALIKEHLTRLMLTSPGERPNNYFYGSNLKNYLFNFSDVVKQDMETTFIDLIKEKVPEITIKNFSVVLSEDKNTMFVKFDIFKNETLESYEYSQGFSLEE